MATRINTHSNEYAFMSAAMKAKTDALINFDFNLVHKYMIDTKWIWKDAGFDEYGDPIEHSVPTVNKLKNHISSQIDNCLKYLIENPTENKCVIAGGGFEVEMNIKEDAISITIKFIIADNYSEVMINNFNI